MGVDCSQLQLCFVRKPQTQFKLLALIRLIRSFRHDPRQE
jgi:hypothetical protein